LTVVILPAEPLELVVVGPVRFSPAQPEMPPIKAAIAATGNIDAEMTFLSTTQLPFACLEAAALTRVAGLVQV